MTVHVQVQCSVQFSSVSGSPGPVPRPDPTRAEPGQTSALAARRAAPFHFGLRRPAGPVFIRASTGCCSCYYCCCYCCFYCCCYCSKINSVYHSRDRLAVPYTIVARGAGRRAEREGGQLGVHSETPRLRRAYAKIERTAQPRPVPPRPAPPGRAKLCSGAPCCLLPSQRKLCGVGHPAPPRSTPPCPAPPHHDRGTTAAHL